MLQAVAGRVIFFSERTVFLQTYFPEPEQRDRVNAVGAPGMATDYAIGSQNYSPAGTVNPDGIQGIRRAGWVVAASTGQKGRNEIFIKIYKEDERIG
jgi:hypothetical protein